jgi:predicted nucleic acid-binding protein
VSFLLDTNVVSEWAKPRPDPGVVAWLAEADEDRVFISAATIAEIRYAIERLALGKRRNQLNRWLIDDLPVRFEDRILPVDAQVGDRWGRAMARRQATGRPVSIMDAIIAATAERHDMDLVTRNVADFASLGVRVVNPWRDGAVG